jgi:hypothetical protein
VTYEDIFMTHITSLQIDAFILLSATVAWIYLSMKRGRRKSVLMIFFSIFLVMFFINDKTVSLIGAALTLPFVLCLTLLDRFRNKITLKHNATLSLHYITLVALLLASSGIISLVLHITTGITTVTVEQYTYAIDQQLFSIWTPIIMASLVFAYL